MSASTTVYCPLPPSSTSSLISSPHTQVSAPMAVSSSPYLQVPASVVKEANIPEPVTGEELGMDEKLLIKVLWRVKPGQVGDSLFVTNFAVAVFGEDFLMASSVTGTKCNAIKGSVAKPGLCEKKWNISRSYFTTELRMTGHQKKKKLNVLGN
ncbi:hypothetical protein JTE90_012384 [Oedothorax gibbosus]|uniref:Uncharacterized protein n=1 Tax=Oedothorax gibbosus TaxID=931172 RepID=A0AAV6TVQ0_9ARAC|nr:hypothetical protein JTE90_012384 [Oedothorax gibbosus]